MSAKGTVSTVSVVGLGLIGGSIAAALSSRYTVYGCDVDPDVVRFALSRKIIVGDAREHWQDTDLVFVATPVSAVVPAIAEAFERVGSRAIVTDVASVKEPIAGQLPSGVRYVGGHPMAGTEKGGIRAYSSALFQNAVYVLTRSPETSEADFEAVRKTVLDLGAVPVETTPQAHDRAVSRISHLPHMIAYTLASVALKDELDETLAAGAFRDMTRVASSDPVFWTNVAFSNRKNLSEDMRAFSEAFRNVARALEEGNNTALTSAFAQGRARHGAMTERCLGNPDALFVSVEDKPMTLAKITTILGEQGVNITGLRILNSREGIGGALRLEFSSGEACDRAREVLAARGYRAER